MTVPENDASDWVICHDIWPGPDESDAEPLHVPVSVPGTEGDGWVGREDGPPLPPLQPLADASRRTPTRRKSIRRRVRVLLAMVYSAIWKRTTRLQNAPPSAIGFRSGSSTCSRRVLTCSVIQRFTIQFTPIVRTRTPLGLMFSARGVRRNGARPWSADAVEPEALEATDDFHRPPRRPSGTRGRP